MVAIQKNNVVTEATRKFPAILTQDRNCVSSTVPSDCTDDVSQPSNHAFRMTWFLGRLSNIYGANTNWNTSCKQIDSTTSATDRFRPEVGPGGSCDDFSFPQQDDSNDVMVEQQHQVAQVAAHAPNCRAYTGSIYTYIYIARHAREKHVRCERHFVTVVRLSMRNGAAKYGRTYHDCVSQRYIVPSFRNVYVVCSCWKLYGQSPSSVLLSKSKHERNTEARNNVTRACVAWPLLFSNQSINDQESRVQSLKSLPVGPTTSRQ